VIFPSFRFQNAICTTTKERFQYVYSRSLRLCFRLLQLSPDADQVPARGQNEIDQHVDGHDLGVYVAGPVKDSHQTEPGAQRATGQVVQMVRPTSNRRVRGTQNWKHRSPFVRITNYYYYRRTSNRDFIYFRKYTVRMKKRLRNVVSNTTIRRTNRIKTGDYFAQYRRGENTVVT